MSYVGTPQFESRRPAFRADMEKRRQEFEARLALVEPETDAPADVMSPAELATRLVMDNIPKD